MFLTVIHLCVASHWVINHSMTKLKKNLDSIVHLIPPLHIPKSCPWMTTSAGDPPPPFSPSVLPLLLLCFVYSSSSILSSLSFIVSTPNIPSLSLSVSITYFFGVCPSLSFLICVTHFFLSLSLSSTPSPLLRLSPSLLSVWLCWSFGSWVDTEQFLWDLAEPYCVTPWWRLKAT